MAGAVSAGAYTAGVMDFLFEALDRWHEAKAGGEDVPRHKVVVKLIAGASAGGINGAITAAVGRYAFSPMGGAANPFYDTWVNKIRIEDLLDTADLDDGGPLASILNCRTLTQAASATVGFNGTRALPETRAWLDDPFQVLLTLTNLSGVPYTVRFRGQAGLDHPMTMHKDHVAFAVPLFGDVREGQMPPDVIVLAHPNSGGDVGWQSLAQAALATSAFPLALEPREIWRQPSDYEYRLAYMNTAEDRHIYAKPWPAGGPSPHKFLSVDGGVMNNEPFEMVRTALAGREGRNPREGDAATRAVVMIDPFSEAAAVDDSLDSSLAAVAGKLIGALKSQARFNQIDLTLAEAGDVYSRFLIAPSRGAKKGDRAIAGGGLGGFFGFFHQAFRHHDFMLGRANCQRFLRDWFVLPAGNPLFADNGSETPLAGRAFHSRSAERPDHLQIIPLVAGLDGDPPLPAWPVDAFAGYDAVACAIERRVNRALPIVRDMLLDNFGLGAFGRSLARGIFWLVKSRVRGLIVDAVRKRIDAAAEEVRKNA